MTQKPVKTLQCVYAECGQEFTTADKHYYDEETDVCYCSEGCYEAQTEVQSIMLPNSGIQYTKYQVEMMTDEELIHAFMEVTGKTTLPCKHCHYKFVELDQFVESIRRRCYKRKVNGLYASIELPKTCDFQAAAGLTQGVYYRARYRAIKNGSSKEELTRLREKFSGAFPEKRRECVRR